MFDSQTKLTVKLIVHFQKRCWLVSCRETISLSCSEMTVDRRHWKHVRHRLVMPVRPVNLVQTVPWESWCGIPKCQAFISDISVGCWDVRQHFGVNVCASSSRWSCVTEVWSAWLVAALAGQHTEWHLQFTEHLLWHPVYLTAAVSK